MKIYENLSEIADRFDAFLVDAYGVFWDGSKLITGSAEALATQVSLGKPVCILSNSSMVHYSYDREGLVRGTHYTDVITSGDVFYDSLLRDSLPFPGHKVYVSGVSELDISTNTPFKKVSSLKKADMVYFATPQLTEEEIKQYPKLKACFFKSKAVYNSTTVEPFLERIKAVYESGLPAISTNPDLIAAHHGQWVIRQGTIAEIFRKMGGTIVEYGKPYANIYEYAFKALNLKPSARIAMVGDTFRTDIQGALNAGITPVWCIDTGIAKYEEQQGRSLMKQAGGSLKGITLIHHL